MCLSGSSFYEHQKEVVCPTPQWQEKRNHPNPETMPEFVELLVLSLGPSLSSSIFVLGSDSCSTPIPQSAVTHSRGQLNPMLSHRVWTVIVFVCLSVLPSFIHSFNPSFFPCFIPLFLSSLYLSEKLGQVSCLEHLPQEPLFPLCL